MPKIDFAFTSVSSRDWRCAFNSLIFCKKLENCSYDNLARACLKNSLPSYLGLELLSLLCITGDEVDIGEANADGENADFSPGVSLRIDAIAALTGVAETPPLVLSLLNGSAVSKSYNKVVKIKIDFPRTNISRGISVFIFIHVS